MYAYKRKVNRKKWIVAFLIPATLCATVLGVMFYPKEDDVTQPVMSEDEEMVISLPDKEAIIQLPFMVEAVIVSEYYDGSDHNVPDVSGYEGVYRPNQGVGYAYNGEAFDVLNMVDGSVSEVKQDAVFGNSVSITSGKLVITYQSLDALHVKKGDTIKAGTVLGKASTNAYHASLGNYLHLVVTHDGKLIDPKTILLKNVSDWK